jgi:hypothetical protein
MRLSTMTTGMAVLALFAGLYGLSGGPAAAQGARAYCGGAGGSAAAQKTPPELVPAVAKTFEIGADPARNGTYVRCVGRKLMACSVGANLDCGAADTRRSLPGATAYCRENPGSNFIPMVATGHDTIYDWHCAGPRAVAGKVLLKVDPRGFIAANWKEVR